MSTVTRHLQVMSYSNTVIKVYGDKQQVKEFGKRFERETFPFNYQECEGKHDTMISIITCERYPSEYGRLPTPFSCDHGELLKMEIIHILEDQGFKIINTVYDSNLRTEKLMMYKELEC